MAGCMILRQSVFAKEVILEERMPAETAETVSGLVTNQKDTAISESVDTVYGVSVQFSTVMSEGGSYVTYALKENGELWRITPEMEVVRQNVKKV